MPQPISRGDFLARALGLAGVGIAVVGLGSPAPGAKVLDKLGDVLLSPDPPNNNDVLTFISADGKWENKAAAATPFSAEGTLLSPSAAINVILWRALFACTVTALKGYRVGGTGATVNAGKGTTATPTNKVLASDLSLTSTESWTDGGSVQNTAFAVGDPLIIILASITGSPTEIGIQVDLTRP